MSGKSKLSRGLLAEDKVPQLLTKMKSSFWGVPLSIITEGEEHCDSCFSGATLRAWLREYLEATDEEVMRVGAALLRNNMVIAKWGSKGGFKASDEAVYAFAEDKKREKKERKEREKSRDNLEQTPPSSVKKKMHTLFGRAKTRGRSGTVDASTFRNKGGDSPSPIVRLRRADSGSEKTENQDSLKSPTRPKSMTVSPQSLVPSGGKRVPRARAKSFSPDEETNSSDTLTTPESVSYPASPRPEGGQEESPDVIMAQKVLEIDIALLKYENEALRDANATLNDSLAKSKERVLSFETNVAYKHIMDREKRIEELLKRCGELETKNAVLEAQVEASALMRERVVALESEVEALKDTVAGYEEREAQQKSVVLARAGESEVRVFGKHRHDYESLLEMVGAQPLEAPPTPTTPEPESGEPSSDVVFSGEGELQYASVDGLTRYIVLQSSGTTDMHVVFLTYRSFLRPVALLHRFMRLYCSSQERKVWLRVVSVINTWQKSYPEEWLDSPDLCKALLKFVDDVVEPTLSVAVATKVRRAVRPKALSQRAKAAVKVGGDVYPDIPVGLIGTTLDAMSLLTAVPAEALAQQLVAVDFALFVLVKPEDCFEQTWGSPEVAAQSNLALFTQWFNTLSSYLTWRVLQAEHLDARVALLHSMVNMATRCKELNALHTMMSIMGSLGSTPIHRLKRTWAALPKTVARDYEELSELISPDKNFGALRARTEMASLPMIPYMGTLMGDLLFIHQGHPTLVNGLLNFTKLRQVTNVVRRLRHAQSLTYGFIRHAQVTATLQKLPSYATENEAFERSLLLEPRS